MKIFSQPIINVEKLNKEKFPFLARTKERPDEILLNFSISFLIK